MADQKVLALSDGIVTEVTVQAGPAANAFTNFAVTGQDTVVADQANDTLTLVAGTNITLTTNAATDAITISSTPSHPIDLYNSLGLISKDIRIKQFVALVQSDANGDFTVDWSAAGFTQPPFSVTATALGLPASLVRDRAWATMRSDITTTQGKGYTLRGALIVSILIGGTESIRTAPNVAVHVVAWGF